MGGDAAALRALSAGDATPDTASYPQ
jgi:hypothetical protein